MKPMIALLLLFSLSTSGAALATTPEATWATLQSNLQKNAGLMAQRIHTQFAFSGDEGTLSGQYVTVIRNGAQQNPPVRELETETSDNLLRKKFSALDLAFATTLANHPAKMFTTATDLAWAGSEELEGFTWKILQLRSTTATGRAPVFAKVWFDEAAGRIWKVHAVVEKPGLPGVKSVDVMIKYATSVKGLILPSTVSVTYPISLFFRSGNVSFTQSLSHWHAD